MKLPKTRNENIVIQNLDNETLIYDLLINKAFCLNETSAKVFHACGNNQTLADLRKIYGFSDNLIYLALDELKKNNLIKDEYASPFSGMSRRDVIKKVGLSTMIALPLISGLAAPPSLAASSICSSDCIGPGQNVCANCTGPVTFIAYAAANGGCIGPSFTSFTYNCDNAGIGGEFYHQRN